ncbi:MAG: STAS domain-containing protein [Clostridiales bacterium]|jgi:stage II sporulation protein AA (anti-sigma F factor antagonist)|nr:STAS domain-containing protein [Clostridiales bacterium]
MESTYELHEGALWIRLKGELDHHGAKTLISKLSSQIDSALPLRCILDFSGISFMDSSGLAVILYTHRRMRELGGSIRIIHLPDQAARVVNASGIDRLIMQDERSGSDEE